MKKTLSHVQSFISDEGDWVVHIIKTGFNNKYVSVHEDACEMELGSTRIGTKEEMEDWYKIKIIDY